MTESRHDIDDGDLRAALGAVADQAAPLGAVDRTRVEGGAVRLRRRRTTRTALGASAAVLAVAALTATTVQLTADGGARQTGPATTLSGSPGPTGPAVPLPGMTAPSGGVTLPGAVPLPGKSGVPGPPATPGPVDSGPIMSPALQTARNAAQDVGGGKGGTGVMADVFANMQIDDCYCSVTVFLTDLGRADAYRQAMRQAAPGVDLSLVSFRPAAHTYAECSAEASRVFGLLHRPGLGFQWFGGGPNVDCSVIEAGVDNVAAAQAYIDDPANGIAKPGFQVRAVPGTQAIPLTGR